MPPAAPPGNLTTEISNEREKYHVPRKRKQQLSRQTAVPAPVARTGWLNPRPCCSPGRRPGGLFPILLFPRPPTSCTWSGLAQPAEVVQSWAVSPKPPACSPRCSRARWARGHYKLPADAANRGSWDIGNAISSVKGIESSVSSFESDVSRVDSALSSIESRLSIIELNAKSITSDMREKAIEERNIALRIPPFTGGGNYPLDSF